MKKNRVTVPVGMVTERIMSIYDETGTFKDHFGYDTFREGQEAVIDALLAGKDVLAVMPTGAGKSICYQVPALMMKGITLVISPLISLMKDQVRSLNQPGSRRLILTAP